MARANSPRTSGLSRYRDMRKFGETPEPAGSVCPPPRATRLRYFIQRHAASATALRLPPRAGGRFSLRAGPCPGARSLDPSEAARRPRRGSPLEYGHVRGEHSKGELWSPVLCCSGTAAPGTRRATRLWPTRRATSSFTSTERSSGAAGRWYAWWARKARTGPSIKERDAFAREADITEERPESVAIVVPLPDIEFQLATFVTDPPRGEGWLFEIKLDGYPKRWPG